MFICKHIKKIRKNNITEPQLTKQFFVTLRSNLQLSLKNKSDHPKEIVEKIDSILIKEDNTWADAYEIERLMINLYGSNQMEIELNRRLVEAERNLFPTEYDYYKKEILKLDYKKAEKSSALLNRLINDLQWRYTLTQLKREFSQLIRTRFSCCFILSTALFLLTFLAFLLPKGPYLPLLCSTAGLWGASFSMIIFTSNQLSNCGLEDLRLLKTIGYVLSRVTVGCGASLILYFFLKAGMLSGSMFPVMEAITPMPKSGYGSDLYLLVIWSFLAGFSEKFVPNLLTKTAKKAKLSS